MKANKSAKLSTNNRAYVRVVGSLVALLIMIIIGVMVYFETTSSVDSFDERTEYLTEHANGTAFVALTTNSSAWNIELDNSPVNSGSVNITCFNSTDDSLSYPSFTLAHKTVSVAADAATYFDQVNATYTSNMASTEEGVTDMSTNVFGLAPIIALAAVASIIIGVIIAFGGRKGGGL